MVKKLILISLLCFLNNITLFANQDTFNATVNKTNFSKQEDIIITVTLTDAATKKSPNIQKFYENGFALKNQSKSQNTTVINGKYSSNISWKYVFNTNLTGNIILPEITIQTSKGILTTKKININISDKIISSPSIKKQIYITNSVTEKKIYLQQSFIYNVTITRFIDIANAELNPPTSNDAIIKEIFNEEAKRTIIDGEEAIVSKYYYLITPHKIGKITISPPTLKGAYLDPKQAQNFDPFANFGSFTNFSSNYKNFTIVGQEYEINILAPQYKNQTWLAVKDLKVITTYDDKLTEIIKNKGKLELGEPVTITIKLTAHNITGKELPTLTLPQTNNLKIYADNPKNNTTYDAKNKKIIGTKSITFTLIADNISDGIDNINIPQINIPWWNLTKEKKETAIVKKISFQTKNNKNELQTNDTQIRTEPKSNNNITNNQPKKTHNNLLLFVSLTLNIILICYIIISLYKRKNIVITTKNKHQETTNTKEYKISCKDLDACSNIQNLHDFCLKYFKQNYKIQAHNLDELYVKINQEINHFDTKKIKEIFLAINQSLYAKTSHNKDNLNPNIKEQLAKIIKEIEKNHAKKGKESTKNKKIILL